MDIFEVFDKRYSCRKYTDEKVDKNLLVKIIDSARRAPSACNGQPWHFIAVTDPERVKKVSEATRKGGIGINKFTENVQSFIVLLKETPLVNRIAKLISHDYTPNDVGIAMATMTYTATALGLGSCIMGWFDEKKVMEALDVPKGKIPQLILAVGYPAEQGRNPKKKELSEICSFDRYGNKEFIEE